MPDVKDKPQALEVCMLELLNIPKPLKESCFSENQINTLFNLWREFMYERFKTGLSPEQARLDVDRLYSQATTVARKYNTLRLDASTGVGNTGPAITLHEKDWVMGEVVPTPFIAFLRQRPQVMEMLRMSFKPYLLHRGMLEAPDFIMLLLRYIFWLKDDKDRKLNVLGVVNDASNNGIRVSTESMIGNLQTNWSNARFHLAILNEDEHWRAVLIDRRANTFEYYDPLGRGIDLKDTNSPLAIQVASLYESAIALDPQIITKTMKSIRRGFHKHQTHGTECGMYVVLFIHTRVAQQKTFEHFAETEIKDHHCRDLKNVFFTVTAQPQPREKEISMTNKDYRIKYGAYDIRLAALEFARYMDYVVQILDMVGSQQKIRADQQLLLKMATAPGDYIAIRIKGMELQKDILSVLPGQYKTYAGSDIWFSIIQEIVSDPLTKHFRKVSSGGGARSRNTIRKKLAIKFFNDIVGWRTQLGAPAEQVQKLEAFMRELIDNFYVPILSFSKDNTRRFLPGMLASSFIRETMARQDSVSFGVHFLRELNRFVMKEFNFRPHTELDTKYRVISTVVKPTSVNNINEIRQTVNQCDLVIRQAYDLLRNTFTDRMMLTNQVKSPGINPMLSPISTTLQTQSMQPQIVQQIVELNYKDMVDMTFLSSGLNPWNFPINVPLFTQTQGELPPQNFALYSVNQQDMRALLKQTKFTVYFAIGVMIVSHYIRQGDINDVKMIQIMLVSLYQFYDVTQAGTDERNIICTLLNQLFTAVKSRPDITIALSELIEFIAQFHSACVAANAINNTTAFFQTVNAEYRRILQQQGR